MARLKPVLVPLVLVSILLGAIGWGLYNKLNTPDILTRYMVNTFMVSTEPLVEGDRVPAKLGLVGHGTGFTYKVEEDGSAIIAINIVNSCPPLIFPIIICMVIMNHWSICF